MSKSLDAAILILEKLKIHSELTLSQIADTTNLNITTAHRLLATLILHGWIDKDDKSKTYQLGPGLSKFASTDKNLVKIAKPFLAQLVFETNESAQLCTVTPNNTIITIDVYNSNRYVNVLHTVGTEDPFHCTAVGKAYLAFLSENDINIIVDSIELKRYTNNTIVTKKDLIAELNQIKQQGYAIDNEEIVEGFVCYAAPILNEHSHPIASIGITGPVNRITQSEQKRHAEIVMSIAMQLSKRLQAKIY